MKMRGRWCTAAAGALIVTGCTSRPSPPLQDAKTVMMFDGSSWDSSIGREGRPILLQDHGDPVRNRNIWVRSLDLCGC